MKPNRVGLMPTLRNTATLARVFKRERERERERENKKRKERERDREGGREEMDRE